MASPRTRHNIVLAALVTAIVLTLPSGLLAGEVSLSFGEVWQAITESSGTLARFIVIENRLPALVTALCAGAALAVAGLLMQTCFDNPLAGPSIMGISSGASLGVALVLMGLTGVVGVWGKIALVVGALAGAMLVLALLGVFSTLVKSGDVLLIMGILLGYLTSSAITLLNYFATESGVHSYVMWGMGSFATVGPGDVPLFASLCIVFTFMALFYAKSLNAMLFGENFAVGVGVNTRRVRTGVLFLSGLLTAVVTAWCGPVGFIGLATPHIARMLLATSNHRVLLPVTGLCGALMAIVCQILSVSTGAAIPLNAITPVIGVPVIVYVLFNRRKLLYFN